MMTLRSALRMAVPLALAFLAATSAPAQTSWPTKPIRLIVPFAAGGGTDVAARLVAPEISKALGQPVVVENIGGGNSVVGSTVAMQATDNHTFLFVTPSHTINPLVIAKMPYDAVKDFAPVSLFTMIPYIFVSSKEVPARNVQELISYAKANPGKLTYASSGPGSGARLTTELFAMTTGIQLVHVPYKSTALSVPDIVAGRVSMLFDQEPLLMPLIKSGKVTGLAVGSATRSPNAPDLPTMDEAGVKSFSPVSWIGVLAPRSTPPAVVQRMSREINAALMQPALKERYTQVGHIPVGSTPEQLEKFIREDMERWARVAAQIKLQPE